MSFSVSVLGIDYSDIRVFKASSIMRPTGSHSNLPLEVVVETKKIISIREKK